MAIVALPSYGTDPATVNAANLDGKVDPLATDYNGNIQNVNIAAAAAIANSKLNLASIAQAVGHSGVVTMTGKELLLAKGADVASGTSIALGTDGNCFDITGTTTIQTITAKQAGSVVFLHFDGALTLTDDTGNLELGGSDLTVAAEDEVVLKSDGTNWHLVATSVVDFARGTGTFPSASLPDGSVLQVVYTKTSTVATGTTTIPTDDTIPQITEGDQYMSQAITPGSATNRLKIDVVFHGASSASLPIAVALFNTDSHATNAIVAARADAGATGSIQNICFSHTMVTPSASATTFLVRAGVSVSGTLTFNGVSGAQLLGGVMASSITITEVKAS